LAVPKVRVGMGRGIEWLLYPSGASRSLAGMGRR